MLNFGNTEKFPKRGSIGKIQRIYIKGWALWQNEHKFLVRKKYRNKGEISE